MLAFTFPGQGSQRPGMGRPWADHESWELVDEASRGRRARRRRAAARRRCRRAEGHPQRPAHHLRVEPDGARRGRATRHRAQLLRRPQPRRVHRAHRHRRARLRRGRAPRRASAPTPCTRPAATTRARWPPCSASTTTRSRWRAAAPTATSGSPTSTPPARSSSPVRPRASSRRQATPRSSAPRRSCRCRCRARSTRRSWQPARDRLRKAIAEADPRDTEVPVVSNVDALAARPRQRVDGLLSAQLTSPVRWKHCLLTLSDARRHRLRRARPGRRAHRHGQAHGRRRPHDLGRHARGPRQAARVGQRRQRRWHASHEGEHLFAAERLVGQPRRRRLHAGRRLDRRHPSSRSARCSATSATPRCARRSRGVLQSYIAVDGERVTLRQPIAWLQDGLTNARGAACPPQRPRRRHHRVGHRPARRRCSPTTTSQPRCDTSHEWIVERTGIHERHVGGTTVGLVRRGRPQGARDGRASTRRASTRSCSPPPPPTARAGHARPPCSTSSACAAARSTSTPRAAGSSTRSSPAHGLIAMGAEKVLVHRHRHAVAHHRLERPQHGHPVRRRQRRRGARGRRRARASCSAGTSTPTARRERSSIATSAAPSRWRARRSSAAPCASWSTRRTKSMSHAGVTADDIALVVPHQANVRIIDAACERPRHPDGAAPPSCCTAPATRRRRRSRSRWPTRSTPAGSSTATSCCSSASAPA